MSLEDDRGGGRPGSIRRLSSLAGGRLHGPRGPIFAHASGPMSRGRAGSLLASPRRARRCRRAGGRRSLTSRGSTERSRAARRSGSRTAALAVDLATGRRRLLAATSLALVPASNEKLPVAYAALAVLGPATGSAPRCSATARLGRRRLARRPRACKGYGDPTLSTRRTSRPLARAVRTWGSAA